MSSTYYFLIILFFLATCLITGVVILVHNIINKHKKGIKIGVTITSIPFLIIGTFFLFLLIDSIFTKPYPNEQQLVGIYHLVGASSDVEETDYKKSRLVFKSDGKFTLSAITYISDCREGSYYIDECQSSKVLSMDGCNFASHIHTNWNNFQVRLIFGDNDLEYEERSYLVFEKMPSK